MQLNMKKEQLPQTKYSYILENEDNTAKPEPRLGSEEEEDEDVERKLVIDLSIGTSKCGGGDITPLSGASKRKRTNHQNVGNILSNIFHSKTSPTERVNSDTCEPTDLTLRANESQISESDSEEDAQPRKMFISEMSAGSSSNLQHGIDATAVSVKQDSVDTGMAMSATEFLKRAASNYQQKSPSVPNYNVSESLNLSTMTSVTSSAKSMVSTPKVHSHYSAMSSDTDVPSTDGGKKNRRKKYVPTRCEKLEPSDLAEYVEEYSGMKNGGRSQIGSPESCNDMPMDLSNSSKKAQKVPTYEEDGPLNLSARNSPSVDRKPVHDAFSHISKPVNLTKEIPKPVKPVTNGHAVKTENFDITSPISLNIPQVTPPAASLYSAGFANPLLANLNQQQMRDYLEMLVKMQAQYSHKGLMQPNMQLIQYQAMMQSALLNTSMLGHKQNGFTPVKNDKNENIVKQEPLERTPESKKGLNSSYSNNQMDYYAKAGLNYSPFMTGFNGFSPALPFMGSSPLLDPKPAPGRRRKIRDGSIGTVVERTVIPKLEDIPALHSHMDVATPDKVVEALKNLFTIQPPNPKILAEYGSEDNPVKFFVKDNEQIQTIVDSLLVCCEIMVRVSFNVLQVK